MRTIAIFARWPRLGSVKTRLAPALTAELALRLHVAMLGDALDAASGASPGRRTLWWAGAPTDRDGFRVPEPIEVFEQAAGDLGDRLAHTFATLLGAPGDRVITIGSDCPWVTTHAIEAAFEALDRTDSVVGPATDGGFYLFGLSRHVTDLFRGIPWSTDQTLDALLLRIEEAGLSVTLLPQQPDVDAPADVLGLVLRALREPDGAHHTRAALAAMRLLPVVTSG